MDLHWSKFCLIIIQVLTEVVALYRFALHNVGSSPFLYLYILSLHSLRGLADLVIGELYSVS